jgi:hypothetical protein
MRPPAPRSVLVTFAPPGLLVLGMAVATHSVVRYKLWIVVVYTVLAALLALWVLRSGRSPRTRRALRGRRIRRARLGCRARRGLRARRSVP